jgi:hypothetical protein
MTHASLIAFFVLLYASCGLRGTRSSVALYSLAKLDQTPAQQPQQRQGQ